MGSLDRFIAFVLEETKGVLPLWLCPTQVKVLTLTERNDAYARKIYQTLKDKHIRVELDDRNEKIGYKIREASASKIPYLIIVGDEEEKNNTISIRGRGFENKSGLDFDEFVKRLEEEIATKKR